MPTISANQYQNNSQELYVLLQNKQFEKAKKLLNRELAKQPNNPELWLLLSSIKGQENDMEGVIECCKKVISLDPKHPQAYSHLGNAYAALGEADKGIKSLQKAIQISPDNAAINNNLGAILHLCGRNQEAISRLEIVVSQYPNHLQAHFNLANAYCCIGGYTKARYHFNECLRIDPIFTESYNRLGFLEIQDGNFDSADAYFDKALKIDPRNPSALGGKADVLYREDDIEGAYNLIRPVIDDGIASVNVTYVFTEVCKYFSECEEAIELAESLLERKTLHPMDRSLLGFALGKLHDASGNYDQAFKYYTMGNRYSGQEFDLANHIDLVDRIIASYTPNIVCNIHQASNEFTDPIFIVGMPRSGTSLTEQILACHPDIYGAGELSYIPELSRQTSNLLNLEVNYPEFATRLTEEQLNYLAEQLIRRMRSLSNGEERITDKLPGNYLHLGFISQVFPKAKVIHCVRNPLDTCLSIYFQNFRPNIPYSSRLEYIAEVYNNYKRLMKHWEQVLDIPILTITYSDLVTRQEETSKKIVAFCELDWSKNCLEFHKSRRTVLTASYDQVNKPIYTSSLDRWRNYEKYIAPLQETLASD